jgi:vancomycin resistance protein YoaR
LPKVNIPKFWKNHKFGRGVLIFAAAVLAVAFFFFIYNLAYSGKIFPKTYVGNINLGGKSKQEAEEILSAKIQNVKDNKIKILVDQKNFETSPADLSVTYDAASSGELAWQVGRGGTLKKIILEQLKSVFTANRNLAVFSYSAQKLSDLVTKMQSEVNVPEKDASIVIIDMNPKITPESSGKNLSFAQASESVVNTLGNFQQQVSLTAAIIYPKITQENAQAALAKTKKILAGGGLVLKSDKGTFNLTPGDYASWLNFVGVLGQKETVDNAVGNLKVTQGKTADTWILDVQVNQAKAGDFVGSIALQVNQAPQDSKFGVTNGKVTAFQVSQTGYDLDQAKAVGMISSAIINSEKEITLPIKMTKPTITSSDPAKEGFVELIGQGDTSWRGSPSNRIHNLSLGAEKISGTIVKPGEEFSTVKTIGEIDAAHGFLPELVIKNSTQVVPDFGGGLCQVSTTLFRAVLYSGLKITDRTPHSFRVSYYEPPVGMDATIYDPAPDFKFINDMKTPVLIWAIPGNNSLTFQIYGTKDGRKIDISDPWVGDYVSSGDPIYTESDSLAPGEIKQVERATSGCSASFTYKVTAADGSSLENETFTSKYVPLSNSYLYGPGTTIPPPG